MMMMMMMMMMMRWRHRPHARAAKGLPPFSSTFIESMCGNLGYRLPGDRGKVTPHQKLYRG